MPTLDLPPAPPPPLLPDTDDPVRALLGDDYPKQVILLYLPQRLSHAFTSDFVRGGESDAHYWAAAFLDDDTARGFAMNLMRMPHPLRHPRVPESAEPHPYPFNDACTLVQTLYPASPGLLIMHPDGRRVRHYVR